MSSTNSGLILLVSIFAMGAIYGQEPAQVRKGDAAQQFINQHFGQYEMFMEERGGCIAPKTSSPKCKNAPFDKSQLIKKKWSATYKNKDGKICVRGEYIDPNQGGCMAGGWCSCESDT